MFICASGIAVRKISPFVNSKFTTGGHMKYILLHGMGQNASSWDKTISFLPNDIETVCPELSDFFTEGDCYYSKMYTAFCEYCNHFSMPINLCGLSLGAVLALLKVASCRDCSQ